MHDDNGVNLSELSQSQLKEANDKFYQALASCSVLSMDEVWLQTDNALCVHPGWPPLLGWSLIRESWRRIFQNTQMHKVDTEIITHDLWGDVGWITCAEKIGVVSGNQLQFSLALATNIFVRTKSGWKLIAHHGSPVSSDV